MLNLKRESVRVLQGRGRKRFSNETAEEAATIVVESDFSVPKSIIRMVPRSIVK